MRSDSLAIHYQLSFDSGFHCGTGLRQGLLHRTVVRDANGFLYIPGSTIKGILRDYATQIARFFQTDDTPSLDIPSQHAHIARLAHFATTSNVVTHIFGSVYRPGTLFFDDVLLHPDDRKFFEADNVKSQQIATRTQVSMSRVTRVARRGMLFSSEYGISQLRFHGTIQGLLSGVPTIDDPTISYSLVLLLAALNNVNRIGGGKSAGFGQVNCELTSLHLNSDTYSDQEAIQKVEMCLALLPEFDLYSLTEEMEETG